MTTAFLVTTAASPSTDLVNASPSTDLVNVLEQAQLVKRHLEVRRSSSFARAKSWIGLASLLGPVFATSCGKRHVDPARETKDGLERWDPPTAAFGFHPIVRAECLPADAGRLRGSERTTVQEVAVRQDRVIQSIAADQPRGESRGAIYFTERTGRQGDERGSVHVATLRDGTDKWQLTDLATEEIEPDQIAVGGRRIYWVAKNPLTKTPTYDIRSVAKETHDGLITIQTLSPETAKPSRLITCGPHILWIAGDHIREVNEGDRVQSSESQPAHHDIHLGSPIVRRSHVHERYTGTLTQGMLAADEEAVYAFTGDHALLRIPLVAGPPTVLIATTDSPPTDLEVHGSWVYWLEQGTEIVRCTAQGSYPCRSGYTMKSALAHRGGALRRVPANGGTIENVATDLTDVEHLTLHPSGAPWLTTTLGAAVRISPWGNVHDHAEYPVVRPLTRMTHYRDALVIADSLVERTADAKTTHATRIVLLLQGSP